ncbi:MAG: hypothetical protein LBH93_00125 [Chitinispirillales bacterium]|jgi:hypothetical protein|nr:hypothetical protein [Chitinispirillales bacterium]
MAEIKRTAAGLRRDAFLHGFASAFDIYRFGTENATGRKPYSAVEEDLIADSWRQVGQEIELAAMQVAGEWFAGAEHE